MLRTLVMIRHAKSSWSNPLQSDYERPLNERGEREAVEMGEKLLQRKIVPDLIICSKAKRTKQTAKKLAKVLEYNTDDIIREEKLYHCIPSVLEETLFAIDNKIQTLLIVAHNPGITEFVNQMSPSFNIDNMPTCGIVACVFEADEWNKYSITERKIIFFDYPGKEA